MEGIEQLRLSSLSLSHALPATNDDNEQQPNNKDEQQQ